MKLKLFTHNDLDGIANVILVKQLIRISKSNIKKK